MLGLRSQSIQRAPVTCNRVSCLTTGSKHWLRKRRRLLVKAERLSLQGVMCSRHSATIKALPESTAKMLSGNCINFHNFMQGFVAAAAALDARYFEAN